MYLLFYLQSQNRFKSCDICISIVVVNTGYTGKKAQVWKSTNFDAELYDITGFLWDFIISTYLASR